MRPGDGALFQEGLQELLLFEVEEVVLLGAGGCASMVWGNVFVHVSHFLEFKKYENHTSLEIYLIPLLPTASLQTGIYLSGFR